MAADVSSIETCVGGYEPATLSSSSKPKQGLLLLLELLTGDSIGNSVQVEVIVVVIFDAMIDNADDTHVDVDDNEDVVVDVDNDDGDDDVVVVVDKGNKRVSVEMIAVLFVVIDDDDDVVIIIVDDGG